MKSEHNTPYSAIIESARARLRSLVEKGRTSGDAVLYTGDWRDMIPRSMVRNPSVDSYSFRLYAILLSYASPDSPGTFPQIDILQASSGLSRPTVIEALYRLRLQGWITAIPKERNRCGKFIGSIYLVHPQPLEHALSMRLDPEYSTLLLRCAAHRNRSLKAVANDILASLKHDADSGIDITAPMSAIEKFAAQILLNRTHASGSSAVQDDLVQLTTQLVTDEHGDMPLHQQYSNPVGPVSSDKTRLWLKGLMGNTQVNEVYLDTTSQVNEVYLAGSEKNSSHPSKPHLPGCDENRQSFQQHTDDSAGPYIKVVVKNTTTTAAGSQCNPCSSSNAVDIEHGPLRATEHTELQWPLSLFRDERRVIETFIKQIDKAIQQDLLDEFAGLIAQGVVKNKVMYFRGLCRNVSRGEFTLTSAGLDIRRSRIRQQRLLENQRNLDELQQNQLQLDPHQIKNNPLMERINRMAEIAQGNKD